jgi:predicted metal-binding membrane protein
MISAPAGEQASSLRARLLADPRWLVWLVTATAWLAALLLSSSGSNFADHRGLDGGLTIGVMLTFLVGWQVMIAAMMLPTTIPMLQHFGRASLNQPSGRSALLVFVVAYALLWTVFGIGALFLDAGIHWLVQTTSWLAERPWMVSGVTLTLAGLFQFSSIKDRCLRECRHPVSFMVHHYRRGYRAAFEIGLRHGLHCLGCCWALMLVMFGVGVGNLAWMAAIAGIMLLEKTSRMGRRLVPYVGGAFIANGMVLLLRGALQG